MKGFNTVLPAKIGENYSLSLNFRQDGEDYFEVINCVILELGEMVRLNQYLNFYDVIKNKAEPIFIERVLPDENLHFFFMPKN